MSNKRNPRRRGQVVRHERSRKPVVITASMSAFLASLPLERARKEREHYWKRRFSERRRKNWRRLGLAKKQRKPRKVYGNTFWNHSHDV